MFPIEFSSLDEMRSYICGRTQTGYTGQPWSPPWTDRGCTGCSLGIIRTNLREKACFSRGDPSTRRIIFGEGPGLEEEKQGLPFVGPAGQLLAEKMFPAFSLDLDRDFYTSNIVRCRARAPANSGRQNLVPPSECINTCSFFWKEEIRLIQPIIIVLLGKVAAETVLECKVTMNAMAGNIILREGIAILPMYHPAALLHASSDPEKYEELGAKMRTHMATLKQMVDIDKEEKDSRCSRFAGL